MKWLRELRLSSGIPLLSLVNAVTIIAATSQQPWLQSERFTLENGSVVVGYVGRDAETSHPRTRNAELIERGVLQSSGVSFAHSQQESERSLIPSVAGQQPAYRH